MNISIEFSEPMSEADALRRGLEVWKAVSGVPEVRAVIAAVSAPQTPPQTWKLYPCWNR